MLCIECSGITADGIAAVAAIISAITGGIAIILYNNSLKLINKQIANDDRDIFEKKLDKLERGLKANLMPQAKSGQFMEELEYLMQKEDSYIDDDGYTWHKTFDQKKFDETNCINYFYYYKSIFNEISAMEVYKKYLNSPESLEKKDRERIEGMIVQINEKFIHWYLIPTNKRIVKYLKELDSSEISKTFKSYILFELVEKVCGDYRALISINTKSNHSKFSEYEYDLVHHRENGPFCLIKDNRIPEMFNYLNELRTKYEIVVL